MDDWGRWLEAHLEWLLERFVAEGSTFAAGLAMVLIAISAAILVIILVFRTIPTLWAINTRCKALSKAFKGEEEYAERRRLFALHFSDIVDPAMIRAPKSKLEENFRRYLPAIDVGYPLRLAWSELKETFVDESEPEVIRNTARPHGYIMRAIGNPAYWNWLSGFFVSVGLLFTFIGIIAVLGVSADAINDSTANGDAGGGNFSDIQDAIIRIVQGASSKFYASIGGLFAAILFRLVISIYASLIKSRAERLADLIESGLAYVPEQRLIQDQLEQLKEQTTQLKMFNTDFAVAMGDRFDQALAPVTSSLGDIKTSLEEQGQRTMQVLGEGVGQAIDNIAGGEIRELGRVLGDLRGELAGMSSKLSEGGNAAAEQLSQAATQLRSVSEGFQIEFEAIAKRLNELGQEQSDRVGQALDGLVEKSQEATSGISDGITAAVAKLAGSLDETVAKLDAAGDRNAESLKAMAEGLSSLTTDVGVEARSKMSAALDSAAEQSKAAAAEAAETMRAAYRDAAKDWVEALDSSVRKLADIRESFSAAETAMNAHTKAIDVAANNTRTAAVALGHSADGLKTVVEPISRATTELQTAATSVRSSVETLSNSANSAIERAETLAERMAETAEAAEEAWSSYRGRFAEVDTQLERVLEQMSRALEQNAERLATYVREIDGQLASAVENLGGVVQPLTDLADELENAVRSIQNASERNN